jgi:hypothetical protein
MSHIAAYLGIVSAFAWAIFLLNSQLKEIRSLKAQLSIERDYSKDLEVDTSVCKADSDYLKNGMEDLMRVCKVVG